MTKRTLGAILAVFIAWSAMDFILHGFLLRPLYQATADRWRPTAEMNIPLLCLVMLTITACFVLIYGLLVERKSLASGIQFGALFGLASGISMGFGSYCMMPIPLALAWSWFLASWIEITAAGAIVGAIMRSSDP